MTSREKFEAWAKKEKLGIAYGDCGYVFSSTEMAWRAWQYQDADQAVQLANAESKCRELAAENSGMNVFIEEECFVYSSDTPEPIDANDCKPKTPSTDAFMAEVRAQGVEMFALQQRHIAAEQEQAGDYEFSRHCSISAAEACEFAEELREGKCCEVQS